MALCNTRVTAVIPRTPGSTSVRMERPPGFAYRAGQWGVFTIPGDLTRTLTLSSSPTEPFLEFTKRITASDFSQAVTRLAPGDRVAVQGPGGSFTLPDPPPPSAFLTGGIGITPFRSILRFAADRRISFDRVFLFFNRNRQEIAFREELESFAQADPAFRLVHVLEEPPPGWKGLTGRITREIVSSQVPDPAGRTFWVCGPPPMIAAAEAILAEMGVSPGKVRKESFAGYGLGAK